MAKSGFSPKAFNTGAFSSLAFLFAEAEAAGTPLTWDQVARPWGEANYMYSAAKPVMIVNGDFYEADTGILIEGTPIFCALSRQGLTIFGRDRFGNWKIDPGIVKFVSGIWPMFKGQPGTLIKVWVGSQETPDSPVNWEGPRDFRIGVDYFLDFTVSGRYLAVRFESEGQEPWKLVSYDLDMEVVGTR